jgi:CRISPR-associated protein Cst2
MAFITGLYAIHAPASALNNSEAENITGQVKSVRVRNQEYPYVSAQAWRFWLRDTIAQVVPEWQASPIYRGSGKKQQAFTEGDPIRYWDDDLFGYMRAEKRSDEPDSKSDGTLTRVAPFRTGTLMSAGPVEVVSDFGVMARAEGNPLLHGHEFYRATLVGPFSIDLRMVGTFTVRERTGYHNLSSAQFRSAQQRGLEYVPELDAVRLPLEERQRRVAALLHALGRMTGGAKQTLHYTDVSASFVAVAVLRGGNNPFQYLIKSSPQPEIHIDALDEARTVYADEFLSPLYLGLRQGFADGSRAALEERGYTLMHPRQALDQLAADLYQAPEWFA